MVTNGYENNKNSRRVLIISGPSGAGKSTVVQKLARAHPGEYELIRSVTTRNRRAQDEFYQFATEEMFEKMLQNGEFLEVNIYQGNRCKYGTPKRTVLECLEDRKIPILEIDVNGKKQVDDCKDIYKIIPFSVFITVEPKFLYQRLLDRGESLQDIICRLKASYEEYASSREYDLFVVNDNLDRTVETINQALCSTEKSEGDSVEDYITIGYIRTIYSVLRKEKAYVYKPYYP